MKSSILLFTLSTVLAFPVATVAADQPAAAHEHEEEHTELGEHMEKMGRAFRALNRQISDSTRNQDSLEKVAILRTNAEAGLKLQPALMAEVPEAKREHFLAEYREHMEELLADLKSLETALNAGNNEEAKGVLKRLKDNMEHSHKEFRKEDKKKDKK